MYKNLTLMKLVKCNKIAKLMEVFLNLPKKQKKCRSNPKIMSFLKDKIINQIKWNLRVSKKQVFLFKIIIHLLSINWKNKIQFKNNLKRKNSKKKTLTFDQFVLLLFQRKQCQIRWLQIFQLEHNSDLLGIIWLSFIVGDLEWIMFY